MAVQASSSSSAPQHIISYMVSLYGMCTRFTAQLVGVCMIGMCGMCEQG